MFFKKITAHADNHGRTLLNYKQDGNCFRKEQKKIKMHFRIKKKIVLSMRMSCLPFFHSLLKQLPAGLTILCNLLCL